MKVLHVCWDLGQGGCQQYIVDLLAQQARQNLEVEVLVLTGRGPLSSEVESLCQKISYVGMSGGLSLGFAAKIRRYLKRCDADIVHSHTDNVVFNLVLLTVTHPVIFTDHGGRLLKGRVASRLIYFVFNYRIARMVVISKFMYDFVIKIRPGISNKLCLIHNGVDVPRIVSSPRLSGQELKQIQIPSGRIVGFVGRLIKDKGTEHIIGIAKEVLAHDPEVEFVIVGEGPELLTLKDQAKRHSISDQFHFLGYRKNARDIMKEFDVLLFTSAIEGFGLVIIEAMASGVPCVALESGSTASSEIIRHDVDGYLVKGLDAIQAAAYICELLGNDQLRERFASKGKERVAEEFSMEVNADKVLTAYRSL